MKNKHLLSGGSQSKARFNTDSMSEILLTSDKAKFMMNADHDGALKKRDWS